MSVLSRLTTKWHKEGEKRMLINNILMISSVKFKTEKEQVKNSLEEEVKILKIDDSEDIMKALAECVSLKEFIEELKKINKK